MKKAKYHIALVLVFLSTLSYAQTRSIYKKEFDYGAALHTRGTIITAKYTKSKTDPQVIQNNNEQVAWGWRNGALKLPEQISGDRWRFFLNNTSEVLNNYKPGDYVGIKSKKAGPIGQRQHQMLVRGTMQIMMRSYLRQNKK